MSKSKAGVRKTRLNSEAGDVDVRNMGEKEEDGGGLLTTRVFVGGLGQAVTASDLEKTFSSLGRVEGVEIVRTNGRSFGYMDFEPHSQKSFNKLLSTYNGCIWKGGRLKLEKAKEHYLTRLRREWTEDEARKALCLNAKADTGKSEDSSKKSKLLAEEKMQLKIYFPRLRKVKLLPYSGTGKHKYSFQHVRTPSLPVHFCDCEQHSLPSDNASTKRVTLDAMNNVIGQHELDIMNSVLEKLCKTEAESAAGTIEHNSLREMNDVGHLDGIMALEKEEVAEASDSDNLIINIALEGEDISSAMDKAKEQISSMKLVPNTDVLTRNKPQKKPFAAKEPKLAKKARKLPADGEKQKQSKKKQASEGRLNGFVHDLESRAMESRVESKDVVAGLTSVTINEAPPAQDATSCVRVQKASWRDLVSGKSSSKFKLSDIFEGTSAGTDKCPEPSETTKLDDAPEVSSMEAVSSTMQVEEVAPNRNAQDSRILSMEAISLTVQVEEVDPNKNAQDSKETDFSLKAGNTNGTIDPEADHNTSKPWRDLLSGKSSSLFKLSDISQGPSATAKKFPESSQVDRPGLNRGQSQKSDDVASAECILSSIQPKQVDPSGSTQNSKETNVSPKAININRSIPIETASRMDEVCTFMRCAESQKEWAKVRAAVSASLRSRKRTDDSVAENAKSKPKHR